MAKKQTVHDIVREFKEGIAALGGRPMLTELLKRQVDRLYDAALLHGITLAASVAEDYDKLSSHPSLVSDCILCKLNATKRRHPRPNFTRFDPRVLQRK